MAEIGRPVSPEVIRDIAAARLVPPAPLPETSPPLARQTFVEVPTWLWLDEAGWSPIVVSSSRGVTTVTVRATPTQARWVMCDGGGVTCRGPGVGWTAGASETDTDCAYTHLHSSYGEPDGRFEASVTVTWEFEWLINDVYQGVSVRTVVLEALEAGAHFKLEVPRLNFYHGKALVELLLLSEAHHDEELTEEAFADSA